jgi:hypothetical protein
MLMNGHAHPLGPGPWRRQSARVVALVVIGILYALARVPSVAEAERARLADRFRFERQGLLELPGAAARTVRQVHPALRHISAWISSVGAGVALNDLDGDGLPNDVAYVDTRTDQVIVAPVPGTGRRFPPFELEPSPLRYDSSTMAPMGCLPGDFNEDGRLDVVVYYWGRTPVAFLRTDGPVLSKKGYVPRELVPGGERWFSNAATQADVDGDGHIDLIFGQYFPDDSHILDATAVGTSPMQDSMSRAYNGGRKRLLLSAGGTCGSEPTVSFHEAKGVFPEEVDLGWTLALGAADLDGDLLPEIYFANDFGPDRLLHNRSQRGKPAFALLEGRKTLLSPSSKVLGRDSFKGMGVDFADIDGDGIMDIYVSNIATEFALLESHFAFLGTGEPGLMARGTAPFVDRSEPLGLSRSGWGWEARLADFNNDGAVEALQATGFVRGSVNRWAELQEVAMGNDLFLHDPRSWHRFRPGDDLSGHPRNPFFTRGGDGRFVDIAADLGLLEPGVSRGIATADVDGDGRLDFAVANQWAPSSFYRNQSSHHNSYLGLHLRFPVPFEEDSAPTEVHSGHPAPQVRERPAIGAAATIVLPNDRRLIGQVDGGSGHSGKRSPDLHFGLGTLDPQTRLRVELRWRDPGGKVRRETLELSPGWYTVRLGKPGSQEVAIR